MKKYLLIAFLVIIGSWVFAQERIAVFPFEDMDNILTRSEMVSFYRQFSNEFTNRSSDRFKIVPRLDVEKLINIEAAFQLSDFSAKAKTAEMQRVLNGTRILSGTIGKMGNSITIIVSLYTYPELQQLPGGASKRANTAVELFDKIPELVQEMQNIIAGGGTSQSIPEGLLYEIIGGRTVTITGYTGDATALNIPSRIEGLLVTFIGYWAFTDCINLTSVTIPSSVTSIGDGAFSDCKSLTSVTIPSSVVSIGRATFYDCSSLRSVTIPSSVTSIGESAFSGCSRLRSITIPSSVTSIGEFAFSRCEGLTNVAIPSSVTSIGEWAFSGCSSLTNITVDNRNTAYASIDGVLFDKSIQTIIRYPLGKSQITYGIPSSVKSIGNDAFSGCISLTNVTIPSSVTSIEKYAFAGRGSLTSFTVDNRNLAYASIDGVLFDKNFQTLIRYPQGRSQKTYDIPSSVWSIGEGAFSGCSSLTSITIPSSVKSIRNMAFHECSNLTSLTVDNSNNIYTSIDGVLFLIYFSWLDGGGLALVKYPESRNQRTYVIPSSVKDIGDLAFSGCSSLTSITIPSSVTSIGNRAFYGCSNLTSITIPSSVTFIGKEAFAVCENLTSITIPSSITSIGDGVFYKCSSLRSITIPSSVMSIGEGGFSGCSGLINVTIPSSVMSIGEGAFSGCISLKSVTLSRRTQVGQSAFDPNTRIFYSD